MNFHGHGIGRATAAGIAIVALISGCSNDDNALATQSESLKTQPETTATETTARTETTAATATTAIEDGPEFANQLDGSWTFINRLEAVDPTYEGFSPGLPYVRQWEIRSLCDVGPCDLEVELGAMGNAADTVGSTEESTTFVLELQDDQSFVGRDQVANPTCVGADGSNVVDGGQRLVRYALTFVPASGIEAPRVEGSVTDVQLPNAKGLAAGCIEFHDTEAVIGQPTDHWNGVDLTSLTLGTYEWGGWVLDADQYYRDHHGDLGEYSVIYSDLEIESGCADQACSAVAAHGVVLGRADLTERLAWDGEQVTVRAASQSDCLKNESDEVITANGYDEVTELALTPAIIVDGEVLAWSGIYTYVATPTAEAVAASTEDCAPAHLELEVAASTTQPSFAGL